MDKSQTKKLLNLNSQSAATDEKTKKNEYMEAMEMVEKFMQQFI